MLIRRAMLLLIVGLLGGCTGPDRKMDEDRGWVKHTVSAGEKATRLEREAMELAELEKRYANQRLELTAARKEREEELLDAKEMMGGRGGMMNDWPEDMDDMEEGGSEERGSRRRGGGGGRRGGGGF
jgi:hypothetical protein